MHFIAMIIILLLPVCAFAQYGLGGGTGLVYQGPATESVDGDTRPVSETDRFIVGDHSDPDIILDPSTRSIDIKAHSTDGGCSQMKESIAGGNTYSFTTCVEDDMASNLYCLREDGYWIGHGCQNMGFSSAAFGGGTIIAEALGSGYEDIQNGFDVAFGAVIGHTGGGVGPWPIAPGWVEFTTIGKYDVKAYVNAALQMSNPVKCGQLAVTVFGTNTTIEATTPAPVSPTWIPQAQPTTVVDATRKVVSARVIVPDLLGTPGASLHYDTTMCDVAPFPGLRMYDTVYGSTGLVGTYMRVVRVE